LSNRSAFTHEEREAERKRRKKSERIRQRESDKNFLRWLLSWPQCLYLLLFLVLWGSIAFGFIYAIVSWDSRGELSEAVVVAEQTRTTDTYRFPQLTVEGTDGVVRTVNTHFWQEIQIGDTITIVVLPNGVARYLGDHTDGFRISTVVSISLVISFAIAFYIVFKITSFIALRSAKREEIAVN
jgi:hypothetical protein